MVPQPYNKAVNRPYNIIQPFFCSQAVKQTRPAEASFMVPQPYNKPVNRPYNIIQPFFCSQAVKQSRPWDEVDLSS